MNHLQLNQWEKILSLQRLWETMDSDGCISKNFDLWALASQTTFTWSLLHYSCKISLSSIVYFSCEFHLVNSSYLAGALLVHECVFYSSIHWFHVYRIAVVIDNCSCFCQTCEKCHSSYNIASHCVKTIILETSQFYIIALTFRVTQKKAFIVNNRIPSKVVFNWKIFTLTPSAICLILNLIVLVKRLIQWRVKPTVNLVMTEDVSCWKRTRPRILVSPGY